MASANSCRTLFALLLFLAVQTCSAVNSMSAWLTSLGPQVVIQNATTNGLMYSDCNSNNTPIFDLSSPKYFTLSYQPKPNTPVAGAGYYETGADAKTAASFWYIDANGDIINSYQQCNPATGEFVSSGVDTLISAGMPKPANDTSLSALLVGALEGYRIYYHDTDKNLQQIVYNPSIPAFVYGGVVSRDNFSSGAVSAASDISGDVSVITSNVANIEVAGPGGNNTWSIVQFPENLVNDITNATSRADFLLNTSAPINYALPAWDGNANLGLSINKDYTLNVFYIGTDRKMYSLYSWYGAWDFASNQSESVWPLADESNAPFAIAYDQNDLTVRIYYFSNNTLMEIGYYDDSTWHDAAPVQTFNASAAVTSAPTGSPSNTPAAMSSSGLSSGAKAGVGVGVSLGVLGLISGAVAFFCFRRRRSATRRTDGMTPQQKDISPPTDSKSFDYVTVGSGVWKRDTYAPTVSAAVPTEMDATPRIIHEMPVKSYHELDG